VPQELKEPSGSSNARLTPSDKSDPIRQNDYDHREPFCRLADGTGYDSLHQEVEVIVRDSRLGKPIRTVFNEHQDKPFARL
jgi:hypothetical protein